MGRLLALDIGRKRTGIACTDLLQIVPSGLGYIPTHQLLEWLQKYLSKEPIDRIILGYPKDMNNNESESMRYIRPIAKKIVETYPDIPLEYYDERFTSVLAQRTIIESGIKKMKRREKGLVDEVAAVIILRDYLEHKSII